MANSSLPNLLDDALGFTVEAREGDVYNGRIILVEDCVEISGAFVLHELVKRSLSNTSSDVVIFLSLAQPFTHYDRVLRKMGCNLIAQMQNKRLLFFDMLMSEPHETGKTSDDLFMGLYGKVHKAVETYSSSESLQHITIIIDDLSLLEVIANGSSDLLLHLLHYFHTLTTQFGCSLIILNHRDVYSTLRMPILIQLEYMADTVIKVEPLATGLASDVHGQMTVLNKKRMKVHSFQFRIKDSSTEYFYSGYQSSQ